MMKYSMYALRDLKTTFYPPVLHQNDADAIRSFEQLVHSDNTVYGFAPNDFQLFKVGEYDSSVGTISSVNPIQLICSGGDVF